MPTALKLTVHQGDAVIAQETFERDIVKIGRLASAHLKLDDPKVSRIHAVIEATNDGVGYAIIDMGSTEGTVLNGRKISKERLSDGDELLLGDLRVLVSMGLDAAALGGPAAVAGPPPPPPPSADLGAAVPVGVPVDESAPDTEVSESVVGAERPPVPPPSTDVAPSTETPTGVGPVPESTAPTAPEPPAPAPISALTPAQAQSFPAGAAGPQPGAAAPIGMAFGLVPAIDPWGTVPNNLASDAVPETDRELEIRTVWGTNVLDSFAVTDQPTVTIGDDRRVAGWGPFQRIETCDIQVPAEGLPSKAHPLAESLGGDGTNYVLNIPPGFEGHIQRADGTLVPLSHLYGGGEGAEATEVPGAVRYALRTAETVYLVYGNVILQVRYIRKNRLVPPPFWSEVNYAWLNILVLAIFLHVMVIFGFLSTPDTAAELTEDLFRNPNRFAQFRLTPEQRKKAENTLLKRLKASRDNARGKGKEGKAGSAKNADKKEAGRAAAKGKEKNEDRAKSALDRLLGQSSGKSANRVLMGSGGLGTELREALGGVSGREVGSATGLGGLGTRGVGRGGGGLSMNAVGLGALGTRGRAGSLDGSGYGEGAARLGAKKERDINISAGNAIIEGSLDKELIRRVIKSHIAQIRYCYERELQASPGLFGKVSTQFVISAQGRVQQANVQQTTLNNAKVERCVLSKIKTWRFPKPKGGGIVIVKYPFIFKTSG